MIGLNRSDIILIVAFNCGFRIGRLCKILQFFLLVSNATVKLKIDIKLALQSV